MRRRPALAAAVAFLLVICASLAGAEEPPAAPPAAPAESAPEPPPAAASDAPFGFDGWPRGEALSIQSGELEAVQREGRRRLLFREDVRVRQGDMRLRSARLEATYPEKSGQPDRLVASGGVRLVQGDRRARCETLTYDRVKDLLVCTGDAIYEQGQNRLEGAEIVIDLAAEIVAVTGWASVTSVPRRVCVAGCDAAW